MDSWSSGRPVRAQSGAFDGPSNARLTCPRDGGRSSALVHVAAAQCPPCWTSHGAPSLLARSTSLSGASITVTSPCAICPPTTASTRPALRC